MRRIALIALITCFAPFLAAAPANAQATRTWVSGVGDDANPCSRTAPCKTFAGAISKTAPAGEINCLDPGGFGAVTITKAMTIACDIGTAGVLVSGTNGIIVVAGANDDVVLRGLDFIGLGTGINGIRFDSGRSLVVEKCTIAQFTNFGILHQPNTAGSLLVNNSTITGNGTAAAGGGISVATRAGGFSRAVVSNTALDRNFVGVSAVGIGQVASIQVFQSTISNGPGFGVSATGAAASLKIGGSAILGNGGAAFTGAVTSFGNNEIQDNSNDAAPPSNGGLH